VILEGNSSPPIRPGPTCFMRHCVCVNTALSKRQAVERKTGLGFGVYTD